MSNPTITFPLFGDGFSFNFPTYFTLFGFNIYYYSLFITAGFIIATMYLTKRRKLFNLTKENVLDLLIIAVPCGLIGARIYYMLFSFDNFFAPGQWGNILRFRAGGLAVYGGIIASGLVFIIYSRVKKLPLGNLLDAAGFGLLIGQSIGRWGNFFNREAYGVETDLPWRMGLTVGGATTYVHPSFLYESLWNVVGLILMHIFSKKSKTKYAGQYFLFYVAWYGLGRFMIESVRGDDVLLIPGTELYASQWLAAISFLVAIGILAYNHFCKKGKAADEEDDDDDDADDIDDEDIDDEDLDLSDGPDFEEESAQDEELAELDGATDKEIEDESDDTEDESEDDNDDDDMEELAELDGASADELEDDTEEEHG